MRRRGAASDVNGGRLGCVVVTFLDYVPIRKNGASVTADRVSKNPKHDKHFFLEGTLERICFGVLCA